ncbi:MAG: hypothetical protein A2Z25_23030 [Planctomycetes bacterium RBG_16_55_9]|nr:MAG: hypothetical protein A2Z25_23030 [Planctomycetes bacterium RBG_16_55_9]
MNQDNHPEAEQDQQDVADDADVRDGKANDGHAQKNQQQQTKKPVKTTFWLRHWNTFKINKQIGRYTL